MLNKENQNINNHLLDVYGHHPPTHRISETVFASS